MVDTPSATNPRCLGHHLSTSHSATQSREKNETSRESLTMNRLGRITPHGGRRPPRMVLRPWRRITTGLRLLSSNGGLSHPHHGHAQPSAVAGPTCAATAENHLTALSFSLFACGGAHDLHPGRPKQQNTRPTALWGKQDGPADDPGGRLTSAHDPEARGR